MIPSINGSIQCKEKHFLFPITQLNYYNADNLPWIEDVVSVLEERLQKIETYAELKANKAENAGHVSLIFSLVPHFSGGAYRLIIAPTYISIEMGEEEGAAQALTTLYWKIREEKGRLSCEEITDSPRYQYRGFMMDCSRHFFPVSAVKEMIEQATLRKLNRLHWHLSDDQGYRIESKQYPLLNTIGSWRKEPEDPHYGGYYRQEEIRDIVAYAKARGMEIIPEIDLPGHVSAMVAAYPQLSCQETPQEVPSNFGIHERILCAGKEQTLTFVKNLLDEVCALFPYPYFHIGGDEAPKNEWKNCPHCQEKMKQLGLKNEEALQAWFTEELMSFLKNQGKTGIAWNETLKSGTLTEDAIIQYWAEEGADAGYCDKAFENDRKCIYSFSAYLYLDTMPALNPLRKVYGFREHVNSGKLIPQKNILGWEGTLWAEQIPDLKRLQEMAFPRLLAIAEQSWNGTLSYTDFCKSCRQEIEYLKQDHVYSLSIEEADPHGEKQIQAVIEAWRPMVVAVKGSEKYESVIREIICSKLKGSFEEDEIEDLKRRLFA